MLHTTIQVLNKARGLAKMILQLKEDGYLRNPELDVVVQEATYIEMETRDMKEVDDNHDVNHSSSVDC
jgi:hypothetical protein